MDFGTYSKIIGLNNLAHDVLLMFLIIFAGYPSEKKMTVYASIAVKSL